jgi:hypothetical protein
VTADQRLAELLRAVFLLLTDRGYFKAARELPDVIEELER